MRLQDPVARAYIAWKKAYEVTCPPGTVACNMASFAVSVKNSIAASKARNCLFNKAVRSPCSHVYNSSTSSSHHFRPWMAGCSQPQGLGIPAFSATSLVVMKKLVMRL